MLSSLCAADMISATLLLNLALGVSGSILYEGGTVLAFNETTQRVDVLRDASLLIEGDTITRVSKARLQVGIPNNTNVINATDKIISPGYIDTHTVSSVRPWLWTHADLHLLVASLADPVQDYRLQHVISRILSEIQRVQSSRTVFHDRRSVPGSTSWQSRAFTRRYDDCT